MLRETSHTSMFQAGVLIPLQTIQFQALKFPFLQFIRAVNLVNQITIRRAWGSASFAQVISTVATVIKRKQGSQRNDDQNSGQDEFNATTTSPFHALIVPWSPRGLRQEVAKRRHKGACPPLRPG
jgi:hypothetical protein